MNVFTNQERRLRSGWWIAIFFALLAAMLVPLVAIASHAGRPLSFGVQAVVVAAVSVICQLLRRRPLWELTGRWDARWLRQLLAGGAVGAALMLVPALLLAAAGVVRWQPVAGGLGILLAALAPAAAVVLTEELIFRGFVFQRLLEGIGVWPAQLLLGAYFVLTHMETLRQAGALKTLAAVNIFVASIAFGLAFVRTRGLALPLGMHFAANVVQGPLLGFGVSGRSEAAALMPVVRDVPAWLTGGAFGLEASVPGLVCVIAVAVALCRWSPTARGG